MRGHPGFVRITLRAATVGCALFLLPPAMAAVYPPGQVLPAQTIQQFLSDPSALLTKYPNGGPDMVKAVQDLAASDPSTLNALLGLLAKSNADQAKAIGTALGDVAKSAAGNDPAYATQIQVGVVVANNDSALGAFNSVIGGDIQLTSVTGGVGGGGGGGGGPTTTIGGGNGGSSGSSNFNLTTAVTNIPDSFSILSLTPGSPGSNINNNQSQSTP